MIPLGSSKYHLAIVKYLIEHLGMDLGMGYDIGCGFEMTLANSSLGPLAKSMNFKSLVGLFHGHAHNRICQLQNLGTYIKGLGLKDLEGCEQLFSKLNALVSGNRYSSHFHQHQALSSYFAHLDHIDTYAQLSDFLVNNYHQALAILNTQPALHKLMAELNVDSREVFEQWLKEERIYLTSLKKEPTQETIQLEYFGKLVKMVEIQ
jgi:hypothetical protein